MFFSEYSVTIYPKQVPVLCNVSIGFVHVYHIQARQHFTRNDITMYMTATLILHRSSNADRSVFPHLLCEGKCTLSLFLEHVSTYAGDVAAAWETSASGRWTPHSAGCSRQWRTPGHRMAPPESLHLSSGYHVQVCFQYLRSFVMILVWYNIFIARYLFASDSIRSMWCALDYSFKSRRQSTRVHPTPSRIFWKRRVLPVYIGLVYFRNFIEYDIRLHVIWQL